MDVALAGGAREACHAGGRNRATRESGRRFGSISVLTTHGGSAHVCSADAMAAAVAGGQSARRPAARCPRRRQASHHQEDLRMTDRTAIERKTVTDDGVERHETIEKEYAPGAPGNGDEQVGGAVVGGVGGAAIGAVVGGPVGAVVGGAIGATAGATAGLVDEETEDDKVIQREEKRW
jgi:hypothetical protein